jgi:hypothetical protein
MRCATADGRTHTQTELRDTRIASSTRHSRVVVSPCVVPPLRSRSRHHSQTVQIEAPLTGHQITKHPCPAIPVACQSFECTGRRHLWPVRLAGGWWLVLVCSEIRVLLAGCGWLLVAGSFWEKSTAGWWLISRANRLLVEFVITIVKVRFNYSLALKKSCVL